MSWRRAESVLLAEANVTMKEIGEYFGDGDRMHMVFNFLLNQHIFLAFVRRDAEPIRRVMNLMPDLPIEGQWGTFLRNHDEVDLGRLSTAERREVFDAMGPEPTMIVYDRGIRRRLAPMLEGDQRRLKLAYSLLFALPGTPVLWYGEEIGMGENLALPEREAVRTPLQWSSGENGGFSSARPGDLVRAMPKGEPYGPEGVNIHAQNTDPASLLNFLRELVRLRRSVPEVGWGKWQVLDLDTRVLGLRVEWRGNALFTFHNLGETEIEIDLAAEIGTAPGGNLLDGAQGACRVGRGGRATLPPYGFLWVRPQAERR
jgi:maltose alpha-D-glucosyltransferase/alpha-amylase